MDDTEKAPETGVAAGDKLRLYVAFEGGGAKGIAHVGALKALEREEFILCGFAGTSAGAIVAALAAAGYHADEIIDPVGETTLLQAISPDPGRPLRATDVLGARGWARIARLRGVYASIKVIGVTALAVNGVLAAIAMLLLSAINATAALILNAVLLALICAVVYVAARLLTGLARLTRFRAHLNEALRRKLDLPEGRRVTFADLKGRPCLKIIAADLSKRSLRLFSSDVPEDGRIEVARAVAASICIPVVFAPFRLDDGYYADGGLVSNLPVWPFDERRALDPDAKTIAVEIEDEPREEAEELPAFWLEDLVRTAIFGGGLLNKRAVDGLHAIKVRTTLDVLEFDAPLSKIFAEVKRARAQADNQIVRRVFDVPSLFRDKNGDIRETIRDLLVSTRLAPDLAHTGRVRVAIARPDGRFTKSLRLRHCVGFQHDADESLLLPIERSVVGRAWSTGLPGLDRAPYRSVRSLSQPEDRWARKKVAKDIKWVLTVPIFVNTSSSALVVMPNPDPTFVVVVDGSASLGRDDSRRARFRRLAVREISEAYGPIAREAEDMDDA